MEQEMKSTPEEEATLNALPPEMRETVKQMLINAKLAALTSSSKRTGAKDGGTDPIKYVTAVLDVHNNLRTMTELLATSISIINPESLEKGKLHYLEQLSKFEPIDLLRVIYRIVSKDYGWGDRDRKDEDGEGRLTKLYNSLKQETQSETEVVSSSALDELPPPSLPTTEEEKKDDVTEIEEQPTKKTTKPRS